VYIENVKEKLAENLHELWAMSKIENGWIWGEVIITLYSLSELRQHLVLNLISK